MNAVSSSPFMDRFTNPTFQRRLASVASVGVVLMGLIVLAGWFLDIPSIPSFLSRGASMKADAALGFVIIGVALWLLQRDQPRWGMIGAGLGVTVAILALLTLLQYATGLNFGIDEMLVRDASPTKTSHPGRMSPVSATNLLVMGLAVVLLQRGRDAAAQVLAAIVTFTALLGVTAYLYNAEALVTIGPYTTVALITALTILIATVALLFTRPGRGVM